MQKKYTGYIVGAIVLFILIVWVVTTNNSLVKKRENVKLQWSEVQNTYQRRLDLIPNLVNVVKGASDFEKGTLEKIAEARSKALSALSNNELDPTNYENQKTLQDTLAATANRMIIIIEKYPTLKGTAAYAGLQTQLEGTERRIKIARNDFNAAVADYNRKVRSFPTSLLANLFGFKKQSGFESVAGAEEAIEIKF